MRYPSNVVRKLDTRSGGEFQTGDPEKCFYCTGALGAEHDADCVCLDRPVKVKMTVEMVIAVPRSWSAEEIEFHKNQSSYCLNNMLQELDRQVASREDGSPAPCLCSLATVTYVGEATMEEALAANLSADTEND